LKAKNIQSTFLKTTKNLWLPGILFVICFFVFVSNANFEYKTDLKNGRLRRLMPSEDVIPNTFLPYLILKEKTLKFDSIIETIFSISSEGKDPYFLINTEKGYFSAYPIWTAVMALPFYIIPMILNKIPEMTYHENILKIFLLGRIAASFYATISVILFYFILRQISKRNFLIFLFSLFYAFGTNTWSVSSRGLWQHTISQFFISSVVLFLLLTKKNEKYVPVVGSMLGLAVLTRPTNALLAFVITIYIFFEHRKRFAAFILAAFPCALYLLLYNTITFGGPFSEGYGARSDFAWTTPLYISIPGYLVSPARSFLFISPPLVLTYVFLAKMFFKKTFKEPTDKIYFALGVSFLLSTLVFAKWYTWDGANAFGYRMLSDFLPIAGLFSFLIFEKLKINWKLAFTGLMIYSIFLHYNAVIWRKSRCASDHNWSFYCLQRPKSQPKY